ncbi:MAG TPA: hypothetical protein PKL84_16725 [Candidatus Hydrogenedentes bacterium]|nr:hypothetical protein [Candidatus Hydrogenedentota bacterium]
MKTLDWNLGNDSFLATLAEILKIILAIISALVSLFGGQTA